MIVYNVTIQVEPSIEKEWLNWMKQMHITDVMATKLFLDYQICKVISVQEDETGATYAIQYKCESESVLEEYQEKHAAKLQKLHSDKFEGKFIAFRTILEIV